MDTTPTTDPAPALLTAAQATAMCGMSRDSWYHHVRAGRIPTVRLGRRVYHPRTALEAWAAGTAPTTTPSVEG